MKLWLLKRKFEDRHPWDTVNGFVVRATSSQQARRLAAEQKLDEGSNVWLDPKLSTCRVLKSEGTPTVILRDANAS